MKYLRYHHNLIGLFITTHVWKKTRCSSFTSFNQNQSHWFACCAEVLQKWQIYKNDLFGEKCEN